MRGGRRGVVQRGVGDGGADQLDDLPPLVDVVLAKAQQRNSAVAPDVARSAGLDARLAQCSVDVDEALPPLSRQLQHVAAHRYRVGRRVCAVERARPDVAVLLILGERQRPLALNEPPRMRLVQLVTQFGRHGEHARLRDRLPQRLPCPVEAKEIVGVDELQVVTHPGWTILDADRLIAELADLFGVGECAQGEALLGAHFAEASPARGGAPRLALRAPRCSTRILACCSRRRVGRSCCSTLRRDACGCLGRGLLVSLCFRLILLLPLLFALLGLQLRLALLLPLLVLGDHILAASEVGERLVGVVLRVIVLPFHLPLRLALAATQVLLAHADDLLWLVDVCSSCWIEGAGGRALAPGLALRWQRLGRWARLDCLLPPAHLPVYSRPVSSARRLASVETPSFGVSTDLVCRDAVIKGVSPTELQRLP